MLEAATVEKTHILGGPAVYEPALKKLGVVMDDGLPLAECRPSWQRAMQQRV